MKFGTLSGAKEPITKMLELVKALGDGKVTLDARQADLKISESLTVRAPKGVSLTYKQRGDAVDLTFSPPVLVTYSGVISKNVSSATVTVEKVTVNLGVVTGEFHVD